MLKVLNGHAVLVLEDEPLICLDLAELLTNSGARVLTARRVDDAVRLAETAKLSAAVLDVKVKGQDCSAICRRLADRGVPFIFYTGYKTAPILSEWAKAPVVSKPSTPDDIVMSVVNCLTSGGRSQTSHVARSN
jgi:DNA-binding response OmpR family regulator